MSQFIAAKSDQLNADDLIGGPIRVTITRVSAGSVEQPVNVHYEGDNGKPFRPCKTLRRIMVSIWGSDASQYTGRELMLYRDPEVIFGGMKVGGIRISHASHIDGEQTVVVMKTKGKREAIKIKPLPAAKKQQPPATVAKTGPEPKGEPAEVAAAGSEDVAIADVAAEVVAKFKAATTVEQIDNAWKLSKADRQLCTDADAAWGDVFLAEFKKAKTALQDKVPA